MALDPIFEGGAPYNACLRGGRQNFQIVQAPVPSRPGYGPHWFATNRPAIADLRSSGCWLLVCCLWSAVCSGPCKRHINPQPAANSGFWADPGVPGESLWPAMQPNAAPPSSQSEPPTLQNHQKQLVFIGFCYVSQIARSIDFRCPRHPK